jgi:hypothetical protein
MKAFALGLALVGCVTTGLALMAGEKPPPPETPKAGVTISAAHTVKNLTIFLLHGPDSPALVGKPFLTLQEAIEQKKLVVHETSHVNELAIENVSVTDEVFIQSGDVVKGGKQDRVLSYDLIVPPKSGKVPLASFCVERGRWSQRGGEKADQFHACPSQICGKDLKLAVNATRSQAEVWQRVGENQKKLSENVGKPVASPTSPTSFQLTVEDKYVQAKAEDYTKALAGALEGQNDAIGFVLVINGQVESADAYGSAALFKKLWPKLLQAAATDALAECKKDGKFEQPTAETVKAFLAGAPSGKTLSNDVSARVKVIRREDDKNMMLETQDRERDAVIHRCYLSK